MCLLEGHMLGGASRGGSSLQASAPTFALSEQEFTIAGRGRLGPLDRVTDTLLPASWSLKCRYRGWPARWSSKTKLQMRASKLAVLPLWRVPSSPELGVQSPRCNHKHTVARALAYISVSWEFKRMQIGSQASQQRHEEIVAGALALRK